MSYSSILTLIDSEIELLTAVRDLLSSAATPLRQPRSPRIKSSEPLSVAPPVEPLSEETVTEPVSAARLEATDAPATITPQPRKVRSFRARSSVTRSPARKRPSAPPPAGALTAAIPAGPVAIPAAAVTQRREASLREADTRTRPQEVIAADGTLDALLREMQGRTTAA